MLAVIGMVAGGVDQVLWPRGWCSVVVARCCGQGWWPGVVAKGGGQGWWPEVVARSGGHLGMVARSGNYKLI